ncbi:MAG TPA: hypothetical protein VML96_05180 [Egibacteraceae bacterium]|nr:hypothetical protein [Egibacteraceae bacterium]
MAVGILIALTAGALIGGQVAIMGRNAPRVGAGTAPVNLRAGAGLGVLAFGVYLVAGR